MPTYCSRPLARKSRPVLVRRGDGESAGLAVEWFHGFAFRVTDRDVLALHERYRVSPLAGLVGRKMRAPFRARLGGGVGGIAVGGEVTGHGVSRRTGFVGEGDGQRAVREGIRFIVQFVRIRPVEGQRDLVPLLEFAGDDHRAGAVGLARLHEWRERFRWCNRSRRFRQGGYLRRRRLRGFVRRFKGQPRDAGPAVFYAVLGGNLGTDRHHIPLVELRCSSRSCGTAALPQRSRCSAGR